ncbi:MAG: D-alanyl-D-alanine carboxypeptidase family protein [Solirubrobacterales bacterium]
MAGLAAALALLAAPAHGAEGEPPRPDAASWVVVDAADGDVLAARAPHRDLPMASTTKLMTALLARRELELDDIVTAAPYDAGAAESLMGLRAGESVSVHDLLYGLLLASGNDAAQTLAVAVSGSEDAFVAAMNRAAARLGLDETSYENPIGFDAVGQFTTVTDLTELAIELRADPFLRRVVDTAEITLTEGEKTRRVANRNNLVRELPFVSGVKTGYTDGAGYVLVGSATRGEVSVVSALIGAPSEEARDDGTLELLRYGLSLYRKERVLAAGELLGEAGILDRDVTVPLEASRAVGLTVRRDEQVEVRAEGVPVAVEGPIARGDQLGDAVITVDGAEEARVPLVATRSEDAASLIERIDADLPGERLGAWGLLALGALAALLLIAVPLVWLVRYRRARC